MGTAEFLNFMEIPGRNFGSCDWTDGLQRHHGLIHAVPYFSGPAGPEITPVILLVLVSRGTGRGLNPLALASTQMLWISNCVRAANRNCMFIRSRLRWTSQFTSSKCFSSGGESRPSWLLWKIYPYFEQLEDPPYQQKNPEWKENHILVISTDAT